MAPPRVPARCVYESSALSAPFCIASFDRVYAQDCVPGNISVALIVSSADHPRSSHSCETAADRFSSAIVRLIHRDELHRMTRSVAQVQRRVPLQKISEFISASASLVIIVRRIDGNRVVRESIGAVARRGNLSVDCFRQGSLVDTRQNKRITDVDVSPNGRSCLKRTIDGPRHLRSAEDP